MSNQQNQTDIFSMFGLQDEVAEQRKREQEEKEKRLQEMREKAQASKDADASTNNNQKKEKEKESFEVNLDTFIFHLGESIPITDYFTEEEVTAGITRKKKGETVTEAITAADVRKRLEKDYPDLVAKYTEMVYVKKKNMVMSVQISKKKGCSEKEEVSDPFLSSTLIPYSILRAFITEAHRIFEEEGAEVHADIYYKLDTQQFFLDVPEQERTRYTCMTTESALSLAERLCEHIPYIKVMEIHSHHTMRAIPSKQDDESERNPDVLYAIVGEVDNYFPTINVRGFLDARDEFFSVSPWKVFESPFVPSSQEEVIR